MLVIHGRVKLVQLHFVSIVLILLNASCYPDDKDTLRQQIPAKTTPFTCEGGEYFIKMGIDRFDHSFFIGEDRTGFFSIQNFNVNRYTLPGGLRIKKVPFPANYSYLQAAQRDSVTAWIFSVNSASLNLNASVMDTSLNITSNTVIVRDPGNSYSDLAAAPTSDKGFVLVASPISNLNTELSVFRYSNAGDLLWKSNLSVRCKISRILPVSDGGYLLAGAGYSGATGSLAISSLLIKLDADGKEEWQKVLHLGSGSTPFISYTINDVLEDVSGDYFILLNNLGKLLTLLRYDSLFTEVKWSTEVHSEGPTGSFNHLPTLIRVEDEMLVYFSGTGSLGSVDIFLKSIKNDGSLTWSRQFGGTGDELVYGLSYQPLGGYTLIATTSNWSGVDASSLTLSYLIRTNLVGVSCY